jgi:outer membrane protein assembly factor BamB
MTAKSTGTGSAGSCVLTKDRRLIVWGGNGDLHLIEAAERSPNHFQELALRTDVLPATPWPHVVVAERRLFCRDRNGHVVCFEIVSDDI